MFLHNITYNSNYNESLRDNAQLILLTQKNFFQDYINVFVG